MKSTVAVAANCALRTGREVRLTRSRRTSYHAPEGGLAIEDIRVRRLRTGERLRLRVSAGQTVRCCAGSVRAGDVVLAAGEAFTFEAPGVVSFTALEGMKDEWVEDTGIVLISLPASLG